MMHFFGKDSGAPQEPSPRKKKQSEAKLKRQRSGKIEKVNSRFQRKIFDKWASLSLHLLFYTKGQTICTCFPYSASLQVPSTQMIGL